MPMKYKVLVDDNFHYMDEDERTAHGEFDTLESAVAACKQIVDAFLAAHHQPGMTAEALYSYYTDFGDDPFIVPKDESLLHSSQDEHDDFSAWDYARKRCAEICSSRA